MEEFKTDGPGTLTEIDEPLEGLDLELQGKIFLIEKGKDGQELSRSELDGELVLKLIVSVLSNSLDGMETKENKEE